MKALGPFPQTDWGLVVLNSLSLNFALKLRVTDIFSLFNIYQHSINEIKGKFFEKKLKATLTQSHILIKIRMRGETIKWYIKPKLLLWHLAKIQTGRENS